MPKEKAGAFPSEGPAATGSSHSAPILADVCSLKTSPELTMARLTLVIACAMALVMVPTLSKPWYQGGKSGSGEGGYSKFHIIRLEYVISFDQIHQGNKTK